MALPSAIAERSTPVGRVMNRFSGDINIIDEVLPGVLQSFVNCAFQVRSLPLVLLT